MEDMFKAAGNKNYSIHEMKNMNHHFQTAIPDSIQNSEEVDEKILQSYWTLMAPGLRFKCSIEKSYFRKRSVIVCYL